jgi:hypothetical protein
VELHQVKALLYMEGNNYQNGETAYIMGEIFCHLDEGLIPRIYKELKN